HAITLYVFPILLIHPPPISTLFPYTTLFRSHAAFGELDQAVVGISAPKYCRQQNHNRASPTCDRSHLGSSNGPVVWQAVAGGHADRKSTRLKSPCNLVCRLLLEKKKKVKHVS